MSSENNIMVLTQQLLNYVTDHEIIDLLKPWSKTSPEGWSETKVFFQFYQLEDTNRKDT